jgi:hypothetical protein
MGNYIGDYSSLSSLFVGVDTGQTTTQDLLNVLITKAESEVNKYLSKRYDLSSSTFQTITSTPPLIRHLTEEIVQGYYYRATSRGGKEALSRSKEYLDMAIGNLKMIADYEVDLHDSLGDSIAEKDNAGMEIYCNTSDYNDTFDVDTFTAWEIDPDKIADINRD